MRIARYSSFVTLALLLVFGSPASLAAQDMGRPSAANAEQHTSSSAAVVTAGQPPQSTGASFFAHFGHDLRRLPSKDTAIVLGIGGALALSVQPVDEKISSQIDSFTSFNGALEMGDLMGSGWMQAGVAAGMLLAGRTVHNPQMTSLAGDLVRAQMVNGLLTQGLKVAINRERPNGGDYSFPSGHTSASFATAAVLQRHLGWKGGVPAYAAAGYVALSRLDDKQHFASDVIFGAAIGLAAGRTVTVGQGANRLALSPLFGRGGIGVAFVRIGAP